jgi:2-dehydro-3-deoxygluconokinase
MKDFFDLNFRSKLWSYDQARAFLENIAHSVHVLFVRQEDMGPLFSLAGDPGDMASRLQQRFGCEAVVLTQGAERVVAALPDRIASRKAILTQSVNRIGVGDSFVAGFIYGYTCKDVDTALAYGTAMAALKTTILNENRPIIILRQVEKLIASLDGAVGRQQGTGDVER